MALVSGNGPLTCGNAGATGVGDVAAAGAQSAGRRSGDVAAKGAGGVPVLSREELHAALVERHGAARQAKFDAACVGVAGLGGLGSNAAVHLARLGVGRLVLADFDCVDVTNLNRQHYTMRDLGRPKAEALAEQLFEINPYLELEVHVTRVEPANVAALFGACDVVLECFDVPEAKAMLVEAVLTQQPGTPLVGGNGMAGCGAGNEIRTQRKFANYYVCGDGQSDSREAGGLFAPRVALCAAAQATCAMRLLLGETEARTTQPHQPAPAEPEPTGPRGNSTGAKEKSPSPEGNSTGAKEKSPSLEGNLTDTRMNSRNMKGPSSNTTKNSTSAKGLISLDDISLMERCDDE